MSAVVASGAATSTDEVRERVRETLASAGTRPGGAALRLIAGGAWLDAGRPVRAERTLCLSGLTGIVDFVPGDFTLTARAGTPLSEIQRVARAENQLLGLDPFGPASGTIGATIATAAVGPMAHAFGLPRDNVIGLEVVTGTGAVVRAGGRVVKNVAGFDLARLFTGSWGTLCAITEVSVRMRGLPAEQATYVLPLTAIGDGVSAFAARLRRAPLAPLALELVSGNLARALGLGSEPALLVRLGGNEDAVRAQRLVLESLGDTAPAAEAIWAALATSEPASSYVLRLSRAPARVGDTWDAAIRIASAVPGALVHASVGRGVARCILPAGAGAAIDDAISAALRFPGTVVAERLPSSAWARVPARGVSDRLNRAVKQSFDPMHILNPGILGEDRT